MKTRSNVREEEKEGVNIDERDDDGEEEDEEEEGQDEYEKDGFIVDDVEDEKKEEEEEEKKDDSDEDRHRKKKKKRRETEKNYELDGDDYALLEDNNITGFHRRKPYKGIARINETALKQIESAYKEYNLEAEKLKKALKDEVQSLRNKVCELESAYKVKSAESASVVESKEHALSSAMSENLSLREDIGEKF